jgi:hypothetical protein
MNLKKIRKNLLFFCNSCFALRITRITPDLREVLICPSCDLNARQRAILLAVQKIRKRNSFFRRQKIIGVSDGAPMANAFSSRFGSSYNNFEYHLEPFLDITQLKPTMRSTSDIVVCSEVLEHVQPPIDLAFFGLYELLKPGGWVVLSVPHTGPNSNHVEHFPVLKNSQLTEGVAPILRGVDQEGHSREFHNLVFHGGAGATLEYRVFSEDSVQLNLRKAGFINIKMQENHSIFGIVWEPWSRVWIAQKSLN